MVGKPFRPGQLQIKQQAAAQKTSAFVQARAFMAQVTAVYTDRATCDLLARDGSSINNVPVLTTGGLINNDVWGDLRMPAVDDWVIVEHVDPWAQQMVITGTVLPFLNSYFSGAQTPVNSSSKQFTKKLLEANLPNTERHITRSGTTWEVGEDGTTTIETPSGAYIQIDEANSKTVIKDKSGNTITMSGSSIQINGSGDYATKFTELETSLSNLQTALASHVHTGVTTGPGSSGPPATPITIDISAAKSTKVEIG